MCDNYGWNPKRSVCFSALEGAAGVFFELNNSRPQNVRTLKFIFFSPSVEDKNQKEKKNK